MTNPHGPNLSPPMISSYSITNATSSQNNNSNNGDSNDNSNDNNEILTMDLISNSTNDPDVPCSAYLDDNDNALLLSIGFPHHSLSFNHIHQFSSSGGFMTSFHAKDHFTADDYKTYFPGQSYFGRAETPNSKPARRGLF